MTTILELLRDLHKHDIHVFCVDDRIQINAPEGALTPEISAALTEQKDALLALLRESSVQSPTTDQVRSESSVQASTPGQVPSEAQAEDDIAVVCCVCGGTVEYYSPLGDPYCETHWTQRLLPPELLMTEAYTTPQAIIQQLKATGTRWAMLPPFQQVLDLETTGLNPRTSKVITLSFGLPGDVTTIDLRTYYQASSSTQQALREALQELLQRDYILWIGHNLKFDWSFLAQQFGVRLKRVYDTMLVERLLHAGSKLSVGLQASAERYGIDVTKEQRSWFIDLDKRPSAWSAALPDAQLTYIWQDIGVPALLYEHQQTAIVRHDLEHVVSLEQEVLPAIAAMELHGISVDVERWRAILATRLKEKEALEARIQCLLGASQASDQPEQTTLFDTENTSPLVQLTSSAQLLKALQALGINVSATTKEALQAAQPQHAVIPLLLEWKALEKFESAFGENLLSYVTSAGRIHATFDQLGAASGRVICRAPNLQQVPRPACEDDPYDVRRCCVAPEGHKLLSADLSNIELRILAEVSGDATMLRFFAEGKDLHSETARLMFKIAPDVDPRTYLVKGKKARDIAKTINFGLAYGMGARGLASRVGVDQGTAQRLIQSYFATYPAVATYLSRSGKEGLTRGYAQSLSGRKRFFTREEIRVGRGEVERSARNHPIQGTNADILKCALLLLYRQVPDDVHVVLAVHDEIVLECPDERIEEATQLLKEAMVQACREYLKVVRIPEPDILIGSYWKKG